VIRFEPDNWIDAVMRPFAMAAPDANIYVEIPAPDLRFAVLVLLAAAALLCWRKLGSNRRPVMLLLGLTALSMWPWLATSGNGRYYIPMLLVVGPLCIGLIGLLPLTRYFRAFLAVLVLGLQVLVVAQNTPWDAWSWLAWKDAPYFQVDAPPPGAGGKPVTYVTVSSISYSLIAPQFPASSRWTSLSAGNPRDVLWTHQFLAEANSLVMVAPALRGQMTADRQPTEAVRAALNVLLNARKLALVAGQPCKFLPSKGLAGIGIRQEREKDARSVEFGFWLCPLRYPVEVKVDVLPAAAARTLAVFARVEELCPRFFQPGTGSTQAIAGGTRRHYAEADIRLYVLDDGMVIYKFWRALNPVVLGSVDDVLSGRARLDCANIRGRAGLPWEREI
jgi:hypothetical protein